MAEKRRFTQADISGIVDATMEEQGRRERDRRDLEKQWDEVDRQKAQIPDLRHKQFANGEADPKRAWMPEVELPLQAQTLEVLMADSRRMTFPQSGPYFQSNAALTDDYLARVDFQAIITGDLNEVPTQIDQDAANKLVAGYHTHIQRQYNFRDHWDLLHMEAFSYGTFVGKARRVRKTLFPLTAKGVVPQTQEFPMMIPRSIRNVYLDDSKHNVMMEGEVVGPTVHEISFRKWDDIKMAAQKGSADPTNPSGGWRKDGLKMLENVDAREPVKVIRVEGDILVPRKDSNKSMFLPNMVAHIAMQSGNGTLIRLHDSGADENSYFAHPYHVENMNSPYGAGPLLKAMPIQRAAVEALTRLMEWAALDVQPPLKYDPNDPHFAQTGGPVVAPGELWGTLSDVTPEQIGDGEALLRLYISFLQQYADLTGVNAPRLGAQTVSHTTAFAKDVENQRGQSRTVDYVGSVLAGPLHKWLGMEYRMGRKFKGTRTIFIEEYGGFVDLKSEHLPDLVSYEVFGASGPLEEGAKLQAQVTAIQTAVQIELLERQLGQPGEPLDFTAIKKEVMRRGFTDVDRFFATRPQDIQNIAAEPGTAQPALTSDTDPIAA